MNIHRLAPHDFELHRELRMRALADSPDSFGETYEAIALLSMTDWERRTAHVTNDNSGVMFVVSIDGKSCGCAYGLVDSQLQGAGRVGGMWVDPTCRRSGAGSALLSAVLNWAEDLGLSPLRLWAPAHEHTARSMYTKAGFRETGQTRPLPTNSNLTIIEMKLTARIDGQ